MFFKILGWLIILVLKFSLYRVTQEGEWPEWEYWVLFVIFLMGALYLVL